MPNHVYNHLLVSGPGPEVAAFAERVSSTDDDGEPVLLDFETTIPMPEELNDGRPDEEIPQLPAWRQWCQRNWGTKWNAHWTQRDGDPLDGELVYRFTTAYAPPHVWLLDAAARHPALDFELEYVEEFLQGSGRMICRNGELSSSVDVDPYDLPWVEWSEVEE